MGSVEDIDNHLPLIAILRGVTPQNLMRIVSILIDEGFTIIEVPLNSPDALTSIRMLANAVGDNVLVGAGTVTNINLAKQVFDTGAKLIVTPNCNPQVIRDSKAAGCAVLSGVTTPTEAFSALDAGTTGLKLFPISMIGVEGVKALKSVLPEGTRCYPVGGITPTSECMDPFLDAGVTGFGLGSALYHPAMSDQQIRSNAQQFVTRFKTHLGN